MYKKQTGLEYTDHDTDLMQSSLGKRKGGAGRWWQGQISCKLNNNGLAEYITLHSIE